MDVDNTLEETNKQKGDRVQPISQRSKVVFMSTGLDVDLQVRILESPGDLQVSQCERTSSYVNQSPLCAGMVPMLNSGVPASRFVV